MVKWCGVFGLGFVFSWLEVRDDIVVEGGKIDFMLGFFIFWCILWW